MNTPARERPPKPTAPVLVAAGSAALLALLAVVVAVRNGAPLPGDLAAHTWSLDHRPPVALAVARAVTATGTGAVPYVIAAVAGLLAAVPRTTATSQPGRTAVASGAGRGSVLAVAAALAFLALGQVLRFGLMKAVGRPRPPVADWATHASGSAFPSGHATTSALAAGLLGWALLAGSRRIRRPGPRRTVCVLLAGWAVAVGLSRVYLGVHWVADVIAGWSFAMCWIAVGIALAPLLRSSIRIPKATAPGGR
ncbi:phosphatase PAP2 family protein [Streptomyces sp. NPDC050738]|uniref:phosphatase PAP2 family protein n=1 Tax=Streptomyces sp. NPDC050738 TaxID=3154744 RepID=UPI0034489C5B